MSRKHRIDQPQSSEELDAIFIHPVKLTKKQEKEAALQLAEARKKTQAAMKPDDLLRAELLKLRFRIEEYLSGNLYDPALHFGYFLKEYVRIQNKKNKIFAGEISIDDAMLSNYINQHRPPPDYLTVRLEIHSNKLIPAEYWYKLVEKERVHFIRTDKELRKEQRQFVHSPLNA
jgi:hypothetical protein